MGPGHVVPDRSAPATAERQRSSTGPTAPARHGPQPRRMLHRCGGGDCDDPRCGLSDELGLALQRAVLARADGPILQRDRTRHPPEQTCEDEVYDPLHQEVEDCKLLKSSCTDPSEREDLGMTPSQFRKSDPAARWSLADIEARRANAARYLTARETFQNTCFAGGADEGHLIAMEQLRNAVATCERKAIVRAAELRGEKPPPEAKKEQKAEEEDEWEDDVNPRSRAGRRGKKETKEVVVDTPKGKGKGGFGGKRGGKGKGGRGGKGDE